MVPEVLGIQDKEINVFFRASLVAQMVKNLPAMRRLGFDAWVRKRPWRREWQPTTVFLPEESHGQRSLAGYSPRGRKGLDTTERLHFHYWLCSNYPESESHSVVSVSLWPHGLYSPRNSPGQNTGEDSSSLLQEFFPTQGSNPSLLCCRWILHWLNHQGSPLEKYSIFNESENILCTLKTCANSALVLSKPFTKPTLSLFSSPMKQASVWGLNLW